MGNMPPMTPAAPDDLLGGATPHHTALDSNLPLEQLDNFQHHLPAMENMGYDQVGLFSNMHYFNHIFSLIEIYLSSLTLIVFFNMCRWQIWAMTRISPLRHPLVACQKGCIRLGKEITISHIRTIL